MEFASRKHIGITAKQMEKMLADFAAENNFHVEYKRGTYNPGESMDITFQVTPLDADGNNICPLAEDFKKYARMYGMKAEWLGGRFVARGRTHTIVGLKTSGRVKYRVTTKRDDGRKYKWTAEKIISKMGGEQQPTLTPKVIGFNPPAAAPKKMKVGDFVRGMLRDGKSINETLEAVLKEFPGAKTTKASVSSMRSVMRRNGEKV